MFCLMAFFYIHLDSCYDEENLQSILRLITELITE